jgi:hypothetical protein
MSKMRLLSPRRLLVRISTSSKIVGPLLLVMGYLILTVLVIIYIIIDVMRYEKLLLGILAILGGNIFVLLVLVLLGQK